MISILSLSKARRCASWAIAARVLYDYERLVRSRILRRAAITRLKTPTPRWRMLRRQHRVNAHPLDQVLQNGTQTGRTLITSEEPALKGFLAAADEAVRDYISRLKTDSAIQSAPAAPSAIAMPGFGPRGLRMAAGCQPCARSRLDQLSLLCSLIGAEKPKAAAPDGSNSASRRAPRPLARPSGSMRPQGRLILFLLFCGVTPMEASCLASFDVIPG